MEPFLQYSLAIFGGGIVTGAAFMFGIAKFVLAHKIDQADKEIRIARDKIIETHRLREQYAKQFASDRYAEKYNPRPVKREFPHIKQVEPLPEAPPYTPYGWE